ncbi:hypothetical protein ACFV7Q_05975 [Streptomyces sp. NPDC059851]|uniref:hypothetical protein n=1 Tax=Streptomyces sp. NPDC059851 TaxID=3346971 RepID=UPI00365A68F1
MSKRGDSVNPRLPDGARLAVPVLAAVGGDARSTVAHLLTDEPSRAGDTVVADLAPRLASPSPGWTSTAAADGPAALPPDQPVTPQAVRRAATVRQAVAGQWSVLTDTRDSSRRPTLPAERARRPARPPASAPARGRPPANSRQQGSPRSANTSATRCRMPHSQPPVPAPPPHLPPDEEDPTR